MKIAVVQGTRPEIIKNYSIVQALRLKKIPHEILHTNQHSTREMRDRIYSELGYSPTAVMRKPYRLGSAIDWLQFEFETRGVTHVIVNGDTAASLAGALAAMYLDIGVSHVEAGLRARDDVMLEERNRIMVDAVASLLFPYTEHEAEQLKKSPDVRGNVFVEGNTTVDVVTDFSEKIADRTIRARYFYATLHRKEFTDSPRIMQSVLATLSEISRRYHPVLLSLHPRTQDAIRRAGIEKSLEDLWVISPVDPFKSLNYQKHARAVITDSGCIQEEAYLLRTPCITVRENTERHETVRRGANRISGFERTSIIESVNWAMSTDSRYWPEIYGVPGVGRRIVEHIIESESEPLLGRSPSKSIAPSNHDGVRDEYGKSVVG